MILLSILHRWSGGFIGFLLAILGLSGAILVWEESWIGVPGARDAVVQDVGQMNAVADKAIGDGATRINFAHEGFGLHQIGLKDGAGAYLNQKGETVATWSSQWERPELWIFDFHHHLFTGETGETVAGVAGLFGLAFVITGSILWWRSRRTFKLRLWPRPFQPGPIVKTHRDLGIILAPLLLLSFTTGVGMVFSGSITKTVLAPFGKMEGRKKPPEIAPHEGPIPVATILNEAKARFPDAEFRRLMLPAKPDGPVTVRLRQPFEWNPNGRTAMLFDGAGKVVRVDDPAGGSQADKIFGTLYPLHAAKLGFVHQLLMTVSGLGLFLLGSMAMYSFWWRRLIHRHSRRARK